MADLDKAQRRFAEALEKLEAAAEHAVGASRTRLTGEAAQVAAELAAVRAERDRLARELESVRASRDALETLADSVSNRLEGTISRVRGALEN